MKTAIIGSRGFFGYCGLCSVLAQYPITQVVSGGAKGADSLAERWSAEKGLVAPLIFLPDWAKYKKAAGFVRNKDIVDAADLVIAFWDGASQGTLHSLKHAAKTKKPTHVWLYDSTTQEIVRLLDETEVHKYAHANKRTS